MKKAYVVLPLLLLGACAQLTGEAYDNDEMYAEETGLYEEAIQPAPQQQYQPQARPMPRPQPRMQQAHVSADGTVIELPPQQIYLDEVLGGAAPMAPAPAMRRAPIQGISYSMPASAGTYQPRPQPPVMVTLQNIAYPNTYVQCLAGDMACVTSYEQQGYRQVQGMPQFAGYQDILAPSDYPQNGRFRNGNNIPRW